MGSDQWPDQAGMERVESGQETWWEGGEGRGENELNELR